MNDIFYYQIQSIFKFSRFSTQNSKPTNIELPASHMKKVQSPIDFGSKHYRFINEFYSKDHDVVEKNSPKKPIKLSQHYKIPSSQSPFLPNLKKTESPLTMVEEEDFYIEKRALRKRESVLRTNNSTSELLKSRLSTVNSGSVHKSIVSMSSFQKSPSFMEVSSRCKIKFNPDVYKKLLERVKRFNLKENGLKNGVSKDEILKIVENLIEKSSEVTKKPKFSKKSGNQNPFYDIENSFSSNYFMTTTKPKLTEKKNFFSEFHITNSYSSNIRHENEPGKAISFRSAYQNLINSQDFSLFPPEEPLQQSQVFKRTSTLNFHTQSQLLNKLNAKNNKIPNLKNNNQIQITPFNKEKNAEKLKEMIRRMHGV